MLRIGEKAPEFVLKGISQDRVADYSLQSFAGKWLVLFFYPADFTFICPTEVIGSASWRAIFAPRALKPRHQCRLHRQPSQLGQVGRC
jgi:alkyl hydroperoxide reductase subunit AhpC